MDQLPASDLEACHRAITRSLRGVMRVAHDVHAALAEGVGVGMTDLLALDRLTASDTPTGVVELGDSLGIRSASATVLVDRLAAAGHLQRDPHPTDKRRRVLHVTEHARESMLEVLRPLVDDINAVTDGLDVETSRAVAAYLSDVCEVLEKFVIDHRQTQSDTTTAGE